MDIQTAFNISIDPNSTPAQKGAATKFLKANTQQAEEWVFNQTLTQEQKFKPTLDRILKLTEGQAN